MGISLGEGGKLPHTMKKTGKFYVIFGPRGRDGQGQPHNVSRKLLHKWQINIKSSSQAKASFPLESFSVSFENVSGKWDCKYFELQF